MATWQGQTRPIMVDVDTVTAGAAETYSYMCVLTKGVGICAPGDGLELICRLVTRHAA